MKIIKIVTDPTQIWRILNKIGWPTTPSEFDEPQNLVEWDVCQLVAGTVDGFPESYNSPQTSGPDPPGFDDYIDPHHWEDSCIQHD